MYILGLDVERTARAVSNVRFEITTNEKIDASETSLRRRLRAPSDREEQKFEIVLGLQQT